MLSWTSFSPFYVDFLWKSLFFGPPLGSAGVRNGAPNRPNGAKKAKKSEFRNHTFAVLKPTCFQDRFGSAPGCHVGRFWMEFWWKSDEFRHHFSRFPAAISRAFFSQLLSKQTARTSRNLQKYTEHLQRTCKKLLKMRTSKKLAENLQRTSKKLARKAKTLQRTSKNPPNKSQNHKRQIACFDATATATNAELQNEGAAVLAPLGAFR